MATSSLRCNNSASLSLRCQTTTTIDCDCWHKLTRATAVLTLPMAHTHLIIKHFHNSTPSKATKCQTSTVYCIVNMKEMSTYNIDANVNDVSK